MTSNFKLWKNLLFIFLGGKSFLWFLGGVVLSFAFSMTVILGTVGIMDGFEHTLKNGLKKSSGDLLVLKRDGFFALDDNLMQIIEWGNFTTYAAFLQSEGILLYNGQNQGVVIRGVDQNFNKVTDLSLELNLGEVALGKDILRTSNLRVGDEITLAFAQGHEQLDGLPNLKRFKIKRFVDHGVFFKDSRLVYLNLTELANILSVENKFNIISLLLPGNHQKNNDLTIEQIEKYALSLNAELGPGFSVRPFWFEYGTLIEAVKIQKLSIMVILQLIVVIAVFNILAFFIYLYEKKSKDIFLVKAMGLTEKSLFVFWITVIIIIWFLSSIMSYFMVCFLDYSLANFSFLKLPGEVYGLSSIKLKLSFLNYFTVLLLSLVWALIIFYFGSKKTRTYPLIQHLRREFF